MSLPRLLRARSAATGGANDGVVVSECINWTLEYMQKHIYLYWLKEASCNVRCSSYWVVWMVETATPHPTFALHCMTYCGYLWVKSVVVRYTKSRPVAPVRNHYKATNVQKQHQRLRYCLHQSLHDAPHQHLGRGQMPTLEEPGDARHRPFEVSASRLGGKVVLIYHLWW